MYIVIQNVQLRNQLRDYADKHEMTVEEAVTGLLESIQKTLDERNEWMDENWNYAYDVPECGSAAWSEGMREWAYKISEVVNPIASDPGGYRGNATPRPTDIGISHSERLA